MVQWYKKKERKENLWVRKFPWRRKWQPTPVFLPGKSHGRRNLAGYHLWGHKRVGHNWTIKHNTILFKSFTANKNHVKIGHGLWLSLFSNSVMSDSLWSHGLQHTRLPCPSPSLGAYLNSCPLSQWYHPAISSSVAPFSSCPQSFPASGSFPMNQFFASCGQSMGVSALASIIPMNILGWFPLGLTGLISLQSKGLSRVFSSPTVWKHQFFSAQPSLWSNYNHRKLTKMACRVKPEGGHVFLTGK